MPYHYLLCLASVVSTLRWSLALFLSASHRSRTCTYLPFALGIVATASAPHTSLTPTYSHTHFGLASVSLTHSFSFTLSTHSSLAILFPHTHTRTHRRGTRCALTHAIYYCRLVHTPFPRNTTLIFNFPAPTLPFSQASSNHFSFSQPAIPPSRVVPKNRPQTEDQSATTDPCWGFLRLITTDDSLSFLFPPF